MTHRPALVLAATLIAALVVPAGAAAGAPPAPRFARQLVAVPAGGKVTVRERGARRASRLRRARALRFGATIDATKGGVRLIAAAPGRGRWEAKADGGAFTVAQTRASKGEVTLRPVGGGITCRAPYGRKGAMRKLRVRTAGRFATRGCFGVARPARPTAGRARASAAPTDWTLVEYPNGWRIRLVRPLYLEVTDLRTGEVKVLHAAGVYDYIYSRRPVLPPGPPVPPSSPGTLTDPQGDLLPCGVATCSDVDLRSASLTVAGGVATFTVEAYAGYSSPSALPVFEIWTSNPTSGPANFHVDPCINPSPACPAGGFVVSRVTPPPYANVATGALSYAGAGTVRYAVPLSALGGASAFKWITGSFTCGFTDRIPDTGFVSYPGGVVAAARPGARVAC